MKRHVFLLIFSIFLILPYSGFSQEGSAPSDSTATIEEEEKEPFDFFDHFFTGGNIGLSIGSTSYIEVAPFFGYRVTEDLGVGIGGTYIYLSNSFYNYKSSVYGGRIFARQMVFENFFAYGELERLYFRAPYLTSGDYLAESAFIGAGYRQEIGGRFYSSISVLYNVLHNEKSPYPIPIVFRGGFSVGF